MTFELRDNQVPAIEEVGGMIRRVETSHPDLISLHSTFAAQTHGCLVRDSLAWEEYWRWDVDDETVAIYYDEGDNPTGYVVYLLENDVFKIKEMVYLNQESRLGLWGYVKAHQSMFERVQGVTTLIIAWRFFLKMGISKRAFHPI